MMSRRRLFRVLCGCLITTIVMLLSYGQITNIVQHKVQHNVQHKVSNFASVSEATSTQLIVSAAASLTNVMEAIQPIYQKQWPEIKLIYNFGSSGSLQQQIQQGAPVDIFISAAPKQMDELEKKGLLLVGTRKNLLTNEIVLIVPKGSTKIKSFNDLTRNQVRRIAIGEPESVPAGKYAQEVLAFLKIFDQIQPKIVYGKDVRQVLNYVATGNVDAGIVYRTDAKNSTQVDTITSAPNGSHFPIIYPIAMIKDSKNPKVAQRFLTFLFSHTAKTVFEQFGFRLSS